MFKRILLKISGEALMGSQEYGIERNASVKVAKLIKNLSQAGHEIGVVIGGGNIFRGLKQEAALGIGRTPSDQIGMLATLMNGLVLQQLLDNLGCDVRVMSALECPTVAEKYQWDHAMRYLKKGYVVVFVGGTGHPYFTTDTCGALRASEIGATLFLKATTRVDGVYNKDPRKHKDATKYSRISYKQFLDEKLEVLDLTAVTLCMKNNIPIQVLNLFEVEESLLKTISDRPFGTLISAE